jgi:glycosyltransferase involved in cell wall biosynthesis
MTEGHERYVFSAGKTGRDYKVLADALRGTGIDAVIVSDDHHVKGIDLPPNVSVQKNIPYSEYMELLEKSILVVVPLKRLVKSTGQVVILEALALGKPVIATETVGTLDYIEHGVNGVLVPPEDHESLRKAIVELISCPSARDSFARNGLERIRRSHTFEVYIRQILLTAEEEALKTQPKSLEA